MNLVRAITGNDEKGLDQAIANFDPRKTLKLDLALDHSLSYPELVIFGDYLVEHGMNIQKVSNGNDSVSILFVRPSREGRGFLGIAAIVLGGLSALGLAGFAGFKLTDAIADNLVPISLIGLGTLVVLFYITRPQQTETIRELGKTARHYR